MSRTIELTHTIKLDEIEAQMLERLEDELGEQPVMQDIEEAAIDEGAVRQGIHNGYLRLTNGNGDQPGGDDS